MNKPLWCPTCHKRIQPPEILNNPNLKAEKGVNIKCGHCNKGVVNLKLEDK